MGATTKQKYFLDFHVIQTVPPSCVNRDDTGSPKTAVYGGVRRARVSSQCWKNAMRTMFREHLDEAKLGTRTKRIVDMVAERIAARDTAMPVEKTRELAERIINAAGVQTKDGTAKALFFLSGFQADNLAELALKISLPAEDKQEKKGKKGAEIPDDVKKSLKAALNKGHGVDIALFGRMVADDPSLNADASAQVAHAISTHKVDNEFDYYTAHDDLKADDTAGASMLGTVEFNSSTLYRYATVAVHDLFRQLGGDPGALAEAVREFARAFALSMPTGKQNSFASRTTPSAVMVALRTDRPVNLADAFEEPVRQSEAGGFAKRSIERLEKHAEKVYHDFTCSPVEVWRVGDCTFSDLLASLEKKTTEIAAALGQGNAS